eukprot:749597-Rhodomonas_salina.2
MQGCEVLRRQTCLSVNALSGTLGYGLYWHGASGPERQYADRPAVYGKRARRAGAGMSLRVSYAMSGTETAYTDLIQRRVMYVATRVLCNVRY